MVWTFFFSSLPFIHPITFISLLQTVINVTTNQNTLKDLHHFLPSTTLLLTFLHSKKKQQKSFKLFFVTFQRHSFFGVSQECYKCKSARWAIKSRSGNLHELINSQREVEFSCFFVVVFVAFRCAKKHKWLNHCFP